MENRKRLERRTSSAHFKERRPTTLERMLVAPYWVNYHLEHHLIFWVPCYRLPLLRQFLFENGHGEKIETEHGYLAVLRKVTRDETPEDKNVERPRASGTFSSGFDAP